MVDSRSDALPTIDRRTAMARVKALIEDQNRIVIDAPEDSLEIDSFTIILIITYAEESLGIRLDIDRLDFENFESLERIEDALFSGDYSVAEKGCND
ncbi:hypothetical protein KAJ83_10450 [Marivibrio halodurans]|uniref:Uncharacterized protein n=1 Tax=Marivibrio halodurans TaxID=2039722 RepID=A0A8J7S2L3_9PROT|nr:hypothetical protein [Marivibrio halodurans]MBP5857428.1 hypothetical protein [Marivibrio halodurans]